MRSPAGGHRLGFELPTESPFHACYFRDELAGRPLSIIDLDGRRNSLTIFRNRFVAAGDEAEDLVEVALDDRAHRIEAVSEAAPVHDVNAPRDVLPDAHALPDGRNA